MSYIKILHQKAFNKNQDSLLERKNDLSFTIAVVFPFLASPYILIFDYLDLNFSKWIVIFTIGMFITSAILNKARLYTLSKTILILGPAVSFFVCANILTPSSGAQLLLFTLIPLPLLLFEYRQRIIMVVCFSILVISYLMLEIGQYSWINYREVIPDESMIYVRCSAIITTFLLLILSAGAYFLSNQKFEEKIEKKNQELLENNQQLEKKNKELKEKADIEKEIKAAKTIQASVLPAVAPKYPGYQLDHFFQSAKAVGGDYYDYFPISADKVGVLIADIVGKGIPASMMMIAFKGLMHNVVKLNLGPAKTFEVLNTIVFSNKILEKYVPAFYGVLDTKNHTFTYSNAGHEPAWFISGNEVLELRDGGFMLGGFETELFEEKTIQFQPGDRLVMFTDGVTDIEDQNEEALKIEGALALIKKHHNASTDTPYSTELAHSIFNFSEKTTQTDDVTIISISRLPSSTQHMPKNTQQECNYSS